MAIVAVRRNVCLVIYKHSAFYAKRVIRRRGAYANSIVCRVNVQSVRVNGEVACDI